MRSAQIRPAEPEAPPDLSVETPPQSRWRRRIVWLLILGVVAAAGGYYWRAEKARQRAKAAIVPIRTARITTGRVEQTLRLVGMTVAERSAIVQAPYLRGSRYTRSTVDFDLVIQNIVTNGVRVKKGDVLTEFDRQYQLLRLDDYKDAVVQARNNIKVLYANLDVRRRSQEQRVRAAKGAWDKALLNLKTEPVRSPIQTERFRLSAAEMQSRYQEYVDQSNLLDVSDLAAIRIYELSAEMSDIELKRAQGNVDKMVVRAPMDGLVVIPSTPHGSEMRPIAQGDQVHSGETFMQVVDMNSMIVTASASQADIEQMRIGTKARIRVDAYPDLELPGHLVTVGAYARSGGWRRSYVANVPVRLKFDGRDARLLPNFSVSADVIINAKDNVTMVPKGCVFTEDGGKRQVVYVQQGENWEKREVELGLDNNLVVEVVNGLKEGETVAAERVPEARVAAAQAP